MNIRRFPLIVWLTILCGCTQLPPDSGKVLRAEGAGAGSTDMAAPTSTTEAERYRCESGEIVAAWYPSDGAATVRYRGRTHRMRLAVSASGARYTGDELEWWTKGGDGMLSRLLADGTSGDIMERCALQMTHGQ